MNKKTLFPSLIIIFTVVLVLFADDTLFEGILMTERLLITNTVNKSSAIFQAGNSAESPDGYQMTAFGTNGVGQVKLKVRNIAGTEHASLSAASTALNIFRVMGTTQVEYGVNAADIVMGQSGGDFQLNSDAIVFGAGKMDIGAPGSPSMRMLSNGVTTNVFGFTELTTITASNFVQSTGSIGGYVGNGAFLTNLPGTAVGGFTPGSTIFAGSTGALSQDNANYFWDITNRRLGVGINSGLLAKVHVVATNGVVFTYMGDSYSTTTNPEDAAGFIGRRARGTVATPTAVQSGDILSIFTGRGYGATGFSQLGRSRMQMEASENWTDTAQGSRVTFYTTPVTTTNPVEVVRFHNDGSVGIGTNAIVSGVKLDVNGPLQVEGPAIITSSGPITNIISSVSGLIPSVYVTNVSIDFTSMPAQTGTNVTFTVPATILTNSVVTIGRPPTELLGLVTQGVMTNNGIVSIRGYNYTASPQDQAALPYRIQITVNPTQ